MKRQKANSVENIIWSELGKKKLIRSIGISWTVKCQALLAHNYSEFKKMPFVTLVVHLGRLEIDFNGP